VEWLSYSTSFSNTFLHKCRSALVQTLWKWVFKIKRRVWLSLTLMNPCGCLFNFTNVVCNFLFSLRLNSCSVSPVKCVLFFQLKNKQTNKQKKTWNPFKPITCTWRIYAANSPKAAWHFFKPSFETHESETSGVSVPTRVGVLNKSFVRRGSAPRFKPLPFNIRIFGPKK